MHRPPHGICLPVCIDRVVDGDTVVVVVKGGSHHLRIRLKDCWAEENDTPEGKRAAKELLSIIESCDHASLFVPVDEKEPLNLFKVLSFERIVGHVFVSHDETLSEIMVRRGFATKEEPKTKRESPAP